MQDVEDWYRQAGIVVPFISNDGYAYGNFAPGTGPGAVDMYGYDSYPLGFDCSQPYVWSGLPNQYFPGLSAPASAPNGTIEANPRWNEVHAAESPSTPNWVAEFQGGSFDPWGGAGFDKCTAFTGAAFERVFYKNSYSFGLKAINYYMLYGGTNWGNLGFASGYTSYDYGAAIAEDRSLMREKYSELKLQANFFKVSPAWLVATPENFDNSSRYASTDDITVTPLRTNTTSFWVIRQSNFSSEEIVSYNLTVPISQGQLTIPRLVGSLSLRGRDSKILITDYGVGSYTILYSTAEVFTWQEYGNGTVLVLYAGPNEINEVAFKAEASVNVLEGNLESTSSVDGITTVQWATSSQRVVFSLGSWKVYILGELIFS
jgi:hypothetical protein